MKRGKIITISGISGVGKSFFKEHIIKNKENYYPLISVTTREKREGEVEGSDKFFLNIQEFRKKYKEGYFCVVNNVFGNMYAYRKSDIEECKYGKNLVTELFYMNVKDFKRDFKNTLSIYILPNNVEEVVNNLMKRNTTLEERENRILGIKKELDYFEKNKHLFDIVIRNDFTVNSCEVLIQRINKFEGSD